MLVSFVMDSTRGATPTLSDTMDHRVGQGGRVEDGASASGIAFRWDPASRLRIATFRGAVTDRHLLSAYGALLDAPDFDPALNDIVDLRAADLRISAGAMWKLIGMLARLDALGIRTRVAVVATRPVAYGLARMYELIRGSSLGATEEIRVFRDYDAAVVWAASQLGC
jgi:hypothetical protein